MILLTGASGSIGGRLVARLAKGGDHEMRLASRRPDELAADWPDLEAVELDVLRPSTLAPALEGIEAAYYLIHSMEPGSEGSFSERDAEGAQQFAEAAREAGVERVIYLGGLGDGSGPLSQHLWSRQETGRILAEHGPPLVELRAAMVVSTDSASYRMLTDLVNRLPAMLVPTWVETPSQPIAVDDVLTYLEGALSLELDDRQHIVVEIGGPDVLSYRDMIELVADHRGRNPVIVGVPFLTPRLSSLWCGLTTSVSSSLARPLIEGMSTPMVVRDPTASTMFPDVHPVGFGEALRRAEAGE